MSSLWFFCIIVLLSTFILCPEYVFWFCLDFNGILMEYSLIMLLFIFLTLTLVLSYQVVELLIAKGANFEHRNVSDYTPLSLAASGGYVGIIKLLLSHGAEINSRTGSKLGISPLMLASMNGHTAAVKLLLDMGSDINAQIETNKNTALTLACFQGRHEVVNLLVERKANIEHRAKVIIQCSYCKNCTPQLRSIVTRFNDPT